MNLATKKKKTMISSFLETDFIRTNTLSSIVHREIWNIHKLSYKSSTYVHARSHHTSGRLELCESNIFLHNSPVIQNFPLTKQNIASFICFVFSHPKKIASESKFSFNLTGYEESAQSDKNFPRSLGQLVSIPISFAQTTRATSN